jgi:hypothetical protein
LVQVGPTMYRVGVFSVCILILMPCDCRSHSGMAFLPPVSTYSKPSHDNHRNLVLSYAQNLSTSNFLPSVREEIKLSTFQVNVLSNVQDEIKISTYNFLYSVRDEISLKHCPLPVFGSQSIRDFTYLHNTVPTVPADTATFGQISLYLQPFARMMALVTIFFCSKSKFARNVKHLF